MDDLKVQYKSLSFQTTLLSEVTTDIAKEIYKYISVHGMFDDDKERAFLCVGKNNKYMSYYDIGRVVFGAASVCHVDLSREDCVAARSHCLLLLQKYAGKSLTKEESVCLKILYPAIEDRYEHFDGSGFPSGKNGTTISLSARVLAVSEFFAKCILNCVRLDVVLCELDKHSGTLFDPELVNIVKNISGQLYAAERSVFELSDDEKTVQIECEGVYDAETENAVSYDLEMQLLDEKLGIISRAAYTPIAEKTNRIFDITKVMLEEVCEKIAMLRFSEADIVKKFVLPISVGCLTKKAFVQYVKRMIYKYKINPEMLIFAVTESVLGYGEDTVFESLSEFKRAGIKIAIDNFGSEFSSLSRLDSFDFDIVKIDRQFIEKIHTHNKACEIVKSMIQVANSLGLVAVADGVDSEVQKNVLQEIGCRYMQGLYFGRRDLLKIDMVSEREMA